MLFVLIFSSRIEKRTFWSNMPSDDNQIVVNLIMIELLGTIFFLAIVTICIYIKRLFVRKSLNGFKVLVKWKSIVIIYLKIQNVYRFPNYAYLWVIWSRKSTTRWKLTTQILIFWFYFRLQMEIQVCLKCWPSNCHRNMNVMSFWWRENMSMELEVNRNSSHRMLPVFLFCSATF